MDVGQKKAYLDAHIESISRHDDESGSVRVAVLEAAKAKIDEEIEAIGRREAERVEKYLGVRDD